MDTNIRRFGPLLILAAASSIVIAAVGVTANELRLPKEVAKPLAPAISHPVAKPAALKPAARKPSAAPIGRLGVIESVREVKEPGEAKGVGALAGGVAGGVLGHKLGKGKGVFTVIGAAGGAFAGHQIEKHARADKRWETSVRLDDGTQRVLPSESEPAWRAGDRVRLVNDRLQAA